MIIPSQLEGTGATISHNSEKDIKKVLELVSLDNSSLLSKINERNKKISNLQDQLYNVLLEMEGQKWEMEELRKALETKDSMLKIIEKDRETHEIRANTMKRALDASAQTRRIQELEMIDLRKELENKKKIEKPEFLKLAVSQIPLPPPESSPSNLSGCRRTIKQVQSTEFQTSRIESSCQSMKKNRKSGGSVTRSRPY